ncbi:MAG: CRISPR-associated endonuclease Cas1 [Rhodospirillales bacterium]|nr:MAG: CRISPR-associated endonuclease Cas1 [Rhodospirillales bacterium]
MIIVLIKSECAEFDLYNSMIVFPRRNHNPPSLFERICHPATLATAWSRVRGNKGAPGGDGETIAAFAARAGARLERLRQELLSGSYRPGPYRSLLIAKPGGGERRLSIPCVVDRVAQAATALVLGEVLEPEFDDASYGYRPGRSVAMAVRRVGSLYRDGYHWVVDGDIRTFFDRVPHAPLLKHLAAVTDDARLVDLVGLWLDGFSEDGLGLPQGSPISPLLANLYLDEVDDEIGAAGVHLVRYGDDFVILCRSEARAEGALERMAALLAEKGLELHPEKTRIVSFQEGFRFLGHLFFRSLVMKSDDDMEPAGETEPMRFPSPDIEAAEAAIAPDSASPTTSAATMGVTPPASVPADAPAWGEGTAPERIPIEPDLAIEPDFRAALGAEPPGRFSPILCPLYVMEGGLRVDLRNEAFIVVDGEAELLAIPPGQVDRIEIGPHVGISDAAIRQAMAWRVPVAMVNGFGEQVGCITPRLARRADLHLAQAACALDELRRLELARIIVQGRLRNQQVQLKRLNREAGVASVTEAAEAIAKLSRRTLAARAVNELMGYEGAATARYWPGLGGCLKHGWRLTERTRQPPKDAANAVISWLASMLARDLYTLILRRDLHPGLAVLHGSRDDHDGAVYDLMEEFRAPLSEGLAVSLFNKRHLRTAHFFARDDEGVRLSREGRTAVIRGYEAKLDSRVRSRRCKAETTWRGLMQEQVNAYARHMVGAERYRPYLMDY